MRIVWPKTDGIVIRGRNFQQRDLVLIRKLIRTHGNWGRTRLSEEVCRALGWLQDNGRLKDRGCRVALLKLEALGFLRLPPKKLDRGGQPPCEFLNSDLQETEVSEMPQSIDLQIVCKGRQSRAWNALIARHHYLGLATPVGRLLRYHVIGDGQILGAISFSEAAWSIKGRDDLLGSFGIDRGRIRSSVISNNRFLIPPYVKVRNLASRVLSLAVKKVAEDWLERFEMRPLFVETFVDPSRFDGACYRAANWALIGTTKGYAKQGSEHQNNSAPKLHFMTGTTYTSQKLLRTRDLRGERRVA